VESAPQEFTAHAPLIGPVMLPDALTPVAPPSVEVVPAVTPQLTAGLWTTRLSAPVLLALRGNLGLGEDVEELSTQDLVVYLL